MKKKPTKYLYTFMIKMYELQHINLSIPLFIHFWRSECCN